MLNPHLLTCDKPLKVRVTSIENGSAKLVFSDSQSFEVSAKFLPSGTKKGEVLYLSLVSDQQLNLGRADVAKAVLDEILS